MNILISSAGRQIFLINAFKEALNKKGYVFVADNNKNAPALHVADCSFNSPTYDSKEYFPWLFHICKKNRIKLLITLNVDELLFLEPQRKSLEKIGCFLVGGDLEIIRITYDKFYLSEFIKNIGLSTPKIFSMDNLNSDKNIVYPIMAKPRYGKGSRGQVILNSYKDLQSFKENVEIEKKDTYIFQQFINGDEFGLDVVNNFKSEYVTTFVRKKHSMNNGETFEATTQSSDDWEEIGRILGKNLKHQGSVDVDFIVQNNEKYLIDVNHRFGGGYIFSHIAGANLPKTYISWLSNVDIDQIWLQPVSGISSKRDEFAIKNKYK